MAGERGSPDTWRDPRGFALKFYTSEGNYDMVGNNTPVFFVRDPLKFQHFIRSQKRRADNNLRDHDMQWDFWTLSPESAHQVTWLMGDRGIPRTWRHMNGYSSHTYMWINAAGEKFWVKYHFKTDQGVEFFTQDEGDQMASPGVRLDLDVGIRLAGAVARDDRVLENVRRRIGVDPAAVARCGVGRGIARDRRARDRHGVKRGASVGSHATADVACRRVAGDRRAADAQRRIVHGDAAAVWSTVAADRGVVDRQGLESSDASPSHVVLVARHDDAIKGQPRTRVDRAGVAMKTGPGSVAAGQLEP